jgi:hypothetical protein
MAKSRKAAIQAAAADVVLNFVKASSQSGTDLDSMDSREKHNRALYEECVREAAAEEEARKAAALRAEEDRLGITPIRQADTAHDTKLGKRWCHTCDEIAAGVEDFPEMYLYKFHNFPISDADQVSHITSEQGLKAYEDFIEIQKDAGVTFSEEDARKLAIFVGLHGQYLANDTTGVNPLENGVWTSSMEMLERWGAIKPKRAAQRVEPKHEITEQSDAAHDRQVVDDEFIDQTGGWITAWSDSVEKGFGIRMTTAQKRKALDYIVARNLPWSVHESWDKARIYLANAGVLVCADGNLPLTEREVIERKMDKLDIANPSQRQEYFRLANYLQHSF